MKKRVETSRGPSYIDAQVLRNLAVQPSANYKKKFRGLIFSWGEVTLTMSLEAFS